MFSNLPFADVANSHNSAGICLLDLGAPVRAIREHRLAFALSKRLGHVYQMYCACTNIALSYLHLIDNWSIDDYDVDFDLPLADDENEPDLPQDLRFSEQTGQVRRRQWAKIVCPFHSCPFI